MSHNFYMQIENLAQKTWWKSVCSTNDYIPHLALNSDSTQAMDTISNKYLNSVSTENARTYENKTNNLLC